MTREIIKKTNAERVYDWGMKSVVFLENKAKFLKKPHYKVIILCYHSIDDSGWRFSTPVESFRRQMKYLKKEHRVLTLKNTLKELRESGQEAVAVTFDDGYESVLKNAAPILRELKIPAALFVVGDGSKANRQMLQNDKKLMDDGQIEELHSQGWEIGYHTKTHAALRKLDEKELNREIVMGRKDFEKRMGFRVNYLSYPQGEYDRRIVEKTREAGYKAAFTVDGYAASAKNFYLISRVAVEGRANDEEFQAIFTPLGIWYTAFYTQFFKDKEDIANLPKYIFGSRK